MVFEKHFIVLCDPSETVSEYLFFTLGIQKNHISISGLTLTELWKIWNFKGFISHRFYVHLFILILLYFVQKLTKMQY